MAHTTATGVSRATVLVRQDRIRCISGVAGDNAFRELHIPPY